MGRLAKVGLAASLTLGAACGKPENPKTMTIQAQFETPFFIDATEDEEWAPIIVGQQVVALCFMERKPDTVVSDLAYVRDFHDVEGFVPLDQTETYDRVLATYPHRNFDYTVYDIRGHLPPCDEYFDDEAA